MTKSTKERRKAPRVIAKLAMQIAGVGEDESVLTTESINLSAGGLQFQSKVSLPALTRVALTLLLPPFGRRLRRGRVVQCVGVVVRSAEIEHPRQKRKFELAGGGSRADRAVRGVALHEAGGGLSRGRGRGPEEALRLPVSSRGEEPRLPGRGTIPRSHPWPWSP